MKPETLKALADEYDRRAGVYSAVKNPSSMTTEEGRFSKAVATILRSEAGTPIPPPPPPPGVRDPALWPFAHTSPWNMPIGSGAQFAAANDPRHAALTADAASINAGYYSHPVYVAAVADPIRTFTTFPGGAGAGSWRVPANAQAANGDDRHLHIVEPTKRFVDEAWNVDLPASKLSYRVHTDLYGPGVGAGGVRAYGGSAIGGLIRTHEATELKIPHALACALPRARLKLGPVWPATLEDSGAPGTYLGPIPMGSLFAIPGTVDIDTLGLTPVGKAIAKAAQDYGCYVVDASGQFVYYAEPPAENLIGGARGDISKIRAQLRAVTNNTPTSVGGGGNPRVPLAPVLP